MRNLFNISRLLPRLKISGASFVSLTFFKKFVLVVLMVSILSGSALTLRNKEANAFICIPCWACGIVDCIVTALVAEIIGEIFEAIIEQNIEDHINNEENWIVEDFFEDYWVIGLSEMTEFLSAFGMYQVEIIGAMLDAKHQLETQRLFWQLQAEAHKDYHPSEELCWFGTNSRSMAASEARGIYNRRIMAKRSIDRQLGNANMSSASSEMLDKQGRWRQFVNTYCDPKDNNWTSAGSGLDMACDHDGPGGAGTTGATNPKRKNRDIDYTRLIEEPRTLEMNFDEPTPTTPVPDDEADVIAMSNNLYGNTVLSRKLSRQTLQNQNARKLYLALRSVVAKRSVAENTFNAIVGMKSSGTSETSASAPLTRNYLAAVFKELMPTGTSNADIYSIIGQNPSYYAQLEVLAKKIYQNPDFYANLYDKPANIARKSVAMKAIDLMLDRAVYESELRQEMIMSVLLSSKMRDDFREINTELVKPEWRTK